MWHAGEVRREGRAYFRGAVVASVITSLLVGIPLALLAQRFSEHVSADEARAAQLEASAAEIRRLAQGAHELGVAANEELARRGLATVPIPAPGSAPDSQVLTAASTAQVAAQLAMQNIRVPSPEQIRAEVAAQLAKLPPPPAGPTPQQLAEAVQPTSRRTRTACVGRRGIPVSRASPHRAWPKHANAGALPARVANHPWAGPFRRPTGPPPGASASLVSIRLPPLPVRARDTGVPDAVTDHERAAPSTRRGR
jgi:hypothetical protein